MDTLVLTLEQDILSDLEDLDLAIKDQSTLEQVADTLDGKEELDSVATEMFLVCTKSLYKRLGIKEHHKAYISLESVSNFNYKLIYAKESVNIALESIGKAIMDFLRAIGRKFMEFIKWITGNAEEVKEKKEEQELKKETEKAKETPKTEEVVNIVLKADTSKLENIPTSSKKDLFEHMNKEAPKEYDDIITTLGLQDNVEFKQKFFINIKISERMKALAAKLTYDENGKNKVLNYEVLTFLNSNFFDIVTNLENTLRLVNKRFTFLEKEIENALNKDEDEDDEIAVKLLESDNFIKNGGSNSLYKLDNLLFLFQNIIIAEGPFGEIKNDLPEYFLAKNGNNESAYIVVKENKEIKIKPVTSELRTAIDVTYINKKNRLSIIEELSQMRDKLKPCYKSSSELQKQIEQFAKKYESMKLDNIKSHKKQQYINTVVKIYVGYLNTTVGMVVKTLSLLKNQYRLTSTYLRLMNKLAMEMGDTK